MRSYTVKKELISSAIREILWNRQTDTDPVTFVYWLNLWKCIDREAVHVSFVSCTIVKSPMPINPYSGGGDDDISQPPEKCGIASETRIWLRWNRKNRILTIYPLKSSPMKQMQSFIYHQFGSITENMYVLHRIIDSIPQILK